LNINVRDPESVELGLDLLALLHRGNGGLDKAIAVLRESKKLCEKHGIGFDGEKILQECLEEKKA
jgi:hypothetical protein